jgi:hypothetical protein
MASSGAMRVLAAVMATGSWMFISSYLILLNRCAREVLARRANHRA